MAKTHLTDAAVERYRRPLKGRTEVSDTEPGLFLWITPNGTKSWVVIYRLPATDGKRTERCKKTVGRFPAMGVAAARDAARDIMELAKAGISPEMHAAEAAAAAAEAAAGTFRAVADEFVTAMKSGKPTGGRKRPVALPTATRRESMLERLVMPTLGAKPLSEITPQMIARLLAQIEKNDGPVDETLKVIRSVFNFAVSRGLHHGLLPTAGLKPRQRPVKITRALSDGELKALWHAAGREGWPFGQVIRLLMLTGQRKSEIAALCWDEVNLERRLLVIRAERVKNRAGAHEVPLSEPAMAIIKEAKAQRDALNLKSPLVFPGDTKNRDAPISGWTQLRKKLERSVRAELAGLTEADLRAIRACGELRPETRERKAAALQKVTAVETAPWVIHDLRHTFITRCRDGDENVEGEIVWSAPLDALQAAVNHEITAGVTGRYDHGDIQRRYRLRKRELMEWWARKLMLIVGEAAPEDNVVPLPIGGRG